MKNLQVVWPKQWIAKEFAKAGCEVVHHSGIEVVKQQGPIWWASELAARSMGEGGHEVFLTAPNWYDLVWLPQELLGRKIRPYQLAELVELEVDAFVKPADCKIVGPNDTGRAMVRNVRNWAEDCLAIGVYPQTVCLVQNPVVWTEEWRCWFDGTELVEASKYQDHGMTWDEWPIENLPYELLLLAEEVGRLIQQPCTIDVGYLDTGQPALVELNPVWSSGPYTSDFGRIYRAIRASFEWAKDGRGRRWEPEPWLLRRWETK